MNIFIVGGSGSGKTTLSNYIKDNYMFNHIEASGNLKKDYPINKNESVIDYINRLSKKSKDILLNDVNYFNKAIFEKMTTNNVISGIRNPNDLLKLINFSEDLVIVLESDYKSDFEKLGIESILSILTFSEKFLGLKVQKCKIDLSIDIKDNFIKSKLYDIIN